MKRFPFCKYLLTFSLLLGITGLLGGQPTLVNAQSGNPNAYGSAASAPNNALYVYASGSIDMQYNARIGACADDGFPFAYKGQKMTGCAIGWYRPTPGSQATEMWLSGISGMTFFTNALPRMVVTADGKVGIGNPDPTHTLQVNGPSVYFTGDLNVDGASNVGSTLRIRGANVAQPYEIMGDVAGLKFFTQGAQRLALTPSGNFDINEGTRIGPSADDGFGFDYRNHHMTGNAISWVQPPDNTRMEMWLSGNNGMTFFTAQQPRMGIAADGSVGVYGNFGVDGTTTTKVLQITGGDLAEPFEIADAATIKPGMVVAIDPDNPGQMRLSTTAYDRTVAGVVSGAGGIHAGVLMYKDGATPGSHPVALSGRVYVYADASNGPIMPGDLLTTAATPGQAMKVTDHERAQGAILGKAMSKLAKGKGLVLVLVTLQ